MKRVLILIAFALLLFSVGCAENVSRMEYSLSIRGFTLSGYYTGEVTDGKPDGYGIYETQAPDGTPCHYIGNWKSGIMHGSGATYWNDGSLEIGEYHHGAFVSGKYNYNGRVLLLVDTKAEISVNLHWIDSSSHDGHKPENGVYEVMYIGNINSHVFHRLDCESVRTMKEKNKVEFYTREEAIERGFTPCGLCRP